MIRIGQGKLGEEFTWYAQPSGERLHIFMRPSSAGLGAGMTEAIFAVTPSETIKYGNIDIPSLSFSWYYRTKLIDDAKSPNPRFRGLAHGTVTIVREEGLRGVYRGLFPVVRLPFS